MNTVKYYLVTFNYTPITSSENHVLTAHNIGSAFDKAKKLFPIDEHKSFRIREISYEVYLAYKERSSQNIR